MLTDYISRVLLTAGRTKGEMDRIMTPTNKKFTISDIAKSAGVSKTTVSRYINGKFEYMSLETRKRIESIIEVANFQPNNLARSLKSQKSGLVGLVVADIESPFSASIIKGIGDFLRTEGYSMIIVNSDNSFEKEKEYIGSLISQRVDGLIVNTTTCYNPFLIDLANRGMPIVLTDRFVTDYNFDIVYIECRESMASMVRHLLEQGYGRVSLFVQPYDKISPRYMRRDAFLETLRETGIRNAEKYVSVVDLSDPESVPSLLKKMLSLCEKDSAPPAVVTTNGVTLLHLVNAVRALKLEMPNEIGLCGYDDWGWTLGMNWSSMIDPGITALSAQTHNIGELSAKVFLERLKNRESSKKRIALPAELIVRGSTSLKKS